MQLNGENASKIIIEGKPIKINPNGFDVGVSEIWKIDENQRVTIFEKQRESDTPKERIYPKEDDFYYLEKGIYEVRLNVKVKIPKNCVAYCLPRSTLNRLGVIKTESAVWDSGYEGYGTQTILIPFNRLKIHKDEAWFQMIVLKSEEVKQEYNGFWQGESKEIINNTNE